MAAKHCTLGEETLTDTDSVTWHYKGGERKIVIGFKAGTGG